MKLSSEEKKIICDFFELFFTKLETVVPKPASPTVASDDLTKNRLIPVIHWNKYYDWPSISGLRRLIFYQDTDGFKKCIHWVGRRIDQQVLFDWIENKYLYSNYFL